VVKLNRRSVQWWTDKTSSSRNALMTGINLYKSSPLV
jgi:hypothetical protein